MNVTFFWLPAPWCAKSQKILGKEELSMTQAIGSCSKNPLTAFGLPGLQLGNRAILESESRGQSGLPL